MNAIDERPNKILQRIKLIVPFPIIFRFCYLVTFYLLNFYPFINCDFTVIDVKLSSNSGLDIELKTVYLENDFDFDFVSLNSYCLKQ